jgi:uncharacterized protein YndB with AHSA1/START domain
VAGEQSISDQAVKARTGRTWRQWTSLLDRWGARKKGHPATARWLREHHGVSAWWAQAITVRYEQDRGLRDVGERPGRGFTTTVQRTIAAPRQRIWEALATARGHNRWFSRGTRMNLKPGGRWWNADGDKGVFRLIEKGKRLRFTWDNDLHCPGTQVEVTLAPRGRGRCVVRLEHSRLGTAEDREEMKEGWSWALDNLRSWLEDGETRTFEEWQAGRGR